MISNVFDYLPRSFRNLKFNFRQAKYGIQKEHERKSVCLNKLETRFPFALGSLYVRKYFNETSKDAAKEILQHTRKEFETTLNKIEWIGEGTRNNAVEKLRAMKSIVGYPDQFLNDTKIENYYKNLEITSGNFFDDLCKVNKHFKDVMFSALGTSTSENDWAFRIDVARANAVFQDTKNRIVISAGILQEPFFKLERPDYLNYGGIGCIMGHEIIHGFDSTGRHFDKDGIYRNWWDNGTANEFDNRVKCLVDQYDGYIVKQINQNVDGDRTKGENIADAGGFKLAYRAYKNVVKSKGIYEQCLPGLDYSPQQMFWIKTASNWCSKATDQYMRFMLVDWHSPAEARVNLAFSNIQEFADDFSCAVGSKMNPAEKCIVW